VLTAVAFVPTPPLLVPELAGASAPDTEELRQACLHAVQLLAQVSRTWMAIGTHSSERTLGPRTRGSWRAFGADVTVSLGPDAVTRPEPELPLPGLVAGWLRGQVDPEAALRLRLYSACTSPDRCRQLGRALAEDSGAQALLVLGDGCTTLTEKAPGAWDERGAAVQRQIDQALSTVDSATLGALDAQLSAELGVSGRVPWQVAAHAVGEGWRGRSLYRGAPFGVGYHVAIWQR